MNYINRLRSARSPPASPLSPPFARLAPPYEARLPPFETSLTYPASPRRAHPPPRMARATRGERRIDQVGWGATWSLVGALHAAAQHRTQGALNLFTGDRSLQPDCPTPRRLHTPASQGHKYNQRLWISFSVARVPGGSHRAVRRRSRRHPPRPPAARRAHIPFPDEHSCASTLCTTSAPQARRVWARVEPPPPPRAPRRAARTFGAEARHWRCAHRRALYLDEDAKDFPPVLHARAHVTAGCSACIVYRRARAPGRL